jgi:hypothetical protein
MDIGSPLRLRFANLPAVKQKTQYPLFFLSRTTIYISCLTLRSLRRQLADAFWGDGTFIENCANTIVVRT